MANAQRKEATFDEIREILREVSENQKETDRKFQETAGQMKETDRRIKYFDKLFTDQWGKLMEAMVKGDLEHR